MKNVEEFYILGKPVETDLGDVQFIKVEEFPNFVEDLFLMTMTKNAIINEFSKQFKGLPGSDEFLDALRKESLCEIVYGTPEFRSAYLNVFFKVMDNESVEKIDGENFDFYRSLILRMNCQKEEDANPNPEIQAAIERSKRVKSLDAEALHFADIVTSIVGFNGLTYDDINNFTVYQLYMTYHRINHIKNFDLTSHFATVSKDVKIESWNKHIDLFETEKHVIEESQLNKTKGMLE